MTADKKLEIITALVSKRTHISIEELRGDSTKREITDARHICKYMCAQYSFCTLEKIGAYYGHSGHSAVKHSIKTVKNIMSSKDFFYKDMVANIKAIKKDISEALGFVPDLEFE